MDALPRPRSDTKRSAVLAAATHLIAKEAGVAAGSLFVYFETKTVLLNELYVALKAEMGSAAVAGLPSEGESCELVRHMWTQWLRWATTHPEKRSALAQLEVAEDISQDSHQRVRDFRPDMAGLLERARSNGAMREVPLGFVLPLASAIADATMDAIIREPQVADDRSDVAFEALWRVLAGPTV